MSHGIMGKDIVPFGAVVFYSRCMSDDDTTYKLVETESWAADNLEAEYDSNADITYSDWLVSQNITENNWTFAGFSDLGKKGSVHGAKWTKDRYCVWLTNTSQYNNGGEIEATLSANNKESFEEFLKDFADKLAFKDINPEEDFIVVTWG